MARGPKYDTDDLINESTFIWKMQWKLINLAHSLVISVPSFDTNWRLELLAHSTVNTNTTNPNVFSWYLQKVASSQPEASQALLTHRRKPRLCLNLGPASFKVHIWMEDMLRHDAKTLPQFSGARRTLQMHTTIGNFEVFVASTLHEPQCPGIFLHFIAAALFLNLIEKTLPSTDKTTIECTVSTQISRHINILRGFTYFTTQCQIC